jgi:hypothetical protein
VAGLVLLNTYYCEMPTLRPPEAIWLFSTPVVRNIARPVSRLFGNWLFRRMYWWQVGGFIRDTEVRREFVPLLYQQFDATPSAQPDHSRSRGGILFRAHRGARFNRKTKGTIQMATTVTSTKAKVRNPEGVRKVLSSYVREGVEIKLQEEGSGWTLEMAYHDEDLDSWASPAALDIVDLPGKDEYPDEDALFEAEWEAFHEKGEEGFLTLLRQLAPHLESPLLILRAAATSDNGIDYAARAWRVEPGAKEVETLEI